MENPMAGPAHIAALQNAIEQNHAQHRTPPRTGGRQISVRLDDNLLNHIETLAELSDWNRSEILYTVANYGLFLLYERNPHIAERTVASIIKKLKIQHPELGDAP